MTHSDRVGCLSGRDARGTPATHPGTLVRHGPALGEVPGRDADPVVAVRADRRLEDDLETLPAQVAAIAHDLRTPLAVLDGHLSLLEDDPHEAQGHADHVQAARRQLRQLDALVDDLQVAVRSSGMICAPVPEVVNVGALAEGSAQDLFVGVSGTDVTIHASPDVRAWVDPHHLQRIVTNLLTNAMRHGRPPVELRTFQRRERVGVVVADAGPGVPQSFIPHLFDRFARGPAAERFEGSGLGLAVVRSLVTANGGTVHYRPNQPHGACFVVKLPSAPTR